MPRVSHRRPLPASVAGPSGGRLDMLPVTVVYQDKNGMLTDAMAPDGTVRVHVIP